jgi:hypothetical protein
MNWSQLTGAKSLAGSLANWANNSTITSGAGGVADTLQAEALQMISTDLVHWRQLVPPVTGTLTPDTVPTPSGQDTLAIPADLSEMKNFYLTGVNQFRLDMKTEEEVIANWSFDGNGNRVAQQPTMYYVNQTYIAFDSPPDQAYTYAYTYYQQIAPLTNLNQTNFVTQFYPRLMRAACMIGVCEWAKELGQGQYDRTYWDTIYQDALNKAQTDSDRSRRATIAGAQFIGGGGPGYPTYGY